MMLLSSLLAQAPVRLACYAMWWGTKSEVLVWQSLKIWSQHAARQREFGVGLSALKNEMRSSKLY